jgi:hypothetical protein
MLPNFDDDVLNTLLSTANQLLGTDAKSWDELVEGLMPPDLRLLKRLVTFYEAEMLRCRDSKAYYAGCVMGAAMLESLLLMLCMEKISDVRSTSVLADRANVEDRELKRKLYSLGFEDLINISAELNWLPKDLISDEWKQGLAEAFKEVVIENRVHMSKMDREQRASALTETPAYSLMLLLNQLRNRIHGGRWLKEGRKFTSEEALSEWAQAAIVGAAHIRDCYITAHMQTVLAPVQNEMKKRILLQL